MPIPSKTTIPSGNYKGLPMACWKISANTILGNVREGKVSLKKERENKK
jgi:hypothetical protein